MLLLRPLTHPCKNHCLLQKDPSLTKSKGRLKKQINYNNNHKPYNDLQIRKLRKRNAVELLSILAKFQDKKINMVTEIVSAYRSVRWLKFKYSYSFSI